MLDKLKVDTKLGTNLAEKLPDKTYQTRWFDHLYGADPNAKCWTVFSTWLAKEEEIPQLT